MSAPLEEARTFYATGAGRDLAGPDGRVNPRWVCCHAVLGRRPGAWEFLEWNTARLNDFRGERPGCFFAGVLVDHDAYDAWLERRVGGGTA